MKVGIVGANGRMGSSLQKVRPEFFAESVLIDHGERLESLIACDAVIDFSTPEACIAAVRWARENEKPFVTGTTGLSTEQQQEIETAAGAIPIVQAANFSVGVNVLLRLAQEGAKATPGFDIEIFEAHHKHKVDSPSGTALALGRAAADGRDADLGDVATWSREGHTGPRTETEIGFQVARGGSVVGTHTVFLYGEGEQIELTHRATDRDIFARGAMRAAIWTVGKSPGRYDMQDVLF